MYAITYMRGHKIETKNGKDWFYIDTKESVPETHTKRTCGHCEKHATVEGHDACLGTLKGVVNACCGHGEPKEAYIMFCDKSDIRGEDAVKLIEVLKILKHGKRN